MLKQNAERILNRRCMRLECLYNVSETAPNRLPDVARRPLRYSALSGQWSYTMRWNMILMPPSVRSVCSPTLPARRPGQAQPMLHCQARE